MHSLVRTVFSKLHTLDPEAEEAKIALGEEDAGDGELKMKVATDNEDVNHVKNEQILETTDSASLEPVKTVEIIADDAPPLAIKRPDCKSYKNFKENYSTDSRWTSINTRAFTSVDKRT